MGKKKQNIENREKFERALWGIKKNRVRTVDLRDCKLNDDDIQLLAKALARNTTLQELNLRNNSITDVGVQCLIEILGKNKTLKTLWLYDNNISDEGAQALSQMLEDRENTTLLALYVKNRYAKKERKKASFFSAKKKKHNEIEYSTQEVIEVLLERNRAERVQDFMRRIRTDNLTNEELDRDGILTVPYLSLSDKEMYPLMQEIHKKKKIKGLCFHPYEAESMTEEKIRYIANALKYNVNLKYLSLRYVRFTKRGSSAIAKALASNTKLGSLDLSCSTFTAERERPPARLDVRRGLLASVMDGNYRNVSIYGVTGVYLDQDPPSSEMYLRDVLQSGLNTTLMNIDISNCRGISQNTREFIQLCVKRNEENQTKDKQRKKKIRYLQEKVAQLEKEPRKSTATEKNTLVRKTSFKV